MKQGRAKKKYVPYKKLATSEILEKKKGWVGKLGGLKGLVNLSLKELKNRKYQYCPDTPDRVYLTNWITWDDFMQVHDYKAHGTTPSNDLVKRAEDKGIFFRR